jgi:hypothetical protein
MIVFLVTRRVDGMKPAHVIINANGREGAKAGARAHLGGDYDHYIVTPLTAPGDVVRFDIIA